MQNQVSLRPGFQKARAQSCERNKGRKQKDLCTVMRSIRKKQSLRAEYMAFKGVASAILAGVLGQGDVVGRRVEESLEKIRRLCVFSRTSSRLVVLFSLGGAHWVHSCIAWCACTAESDFEEIPELGLVNEESPRLP